MEENFFKEEMSFPNLAHHRVCGITKHITRHPKS